MKIFDKKEYLTLEELRRDKDRVATKLVERSQALEQDIVDCFLPGDKTMLQSEVPYIRYAGYGLTAYKTFNIVRKVVGLFKKKRWFKGA